MPFTLSHPAIIIPFRRSKLFGKFLTLLVIGSMSPDFEYLIFLYFRGEWGHSLLGILYFCIPVSIVVFLIWEYLIKPEMYAATFKYPKNISLVKVRSFIDSLVFIVAIGIGALSHIFWDAFTHKTGYFVNVIPFLRPSVTGIPVYNLLQYFFSLLGVIIIFYFIWKYVEARKSYMNVDWFFWIGWVVITTGLIIVRYSLAPTELDLTLLLNIMTFGFIGLAITSWISRLVRNK